ncbi:MAG: hypothetical protein KC933_30115 [Myxococcales bacterium]|nr:hypothetical protein [Myxococcales bacterium]
MPLTLTFIACAPQPELQPDSEVQDALTGGALFFRTFDGSGNNPTHPEWGASGTTLLRGTTNGYADGRSAMAGPNRPSPRQVSNVVLAQARPVPNSFGASNYLWAWGQFLDHDVDLTGLAVPAESVPIAVPQGDQYFDPLGSGSVVIGFERSLWAPDTAGVRQQVNEISAFIDGSNVYGSSEDRAAALRANDGSGRLRTSPGDLLPFNDFGACADDSQCIAGTRCQGGVCALPNATQPGMSPGSDFAAGDVRANEVATLTALHTLFMREHNRIADQFKTLFPFATGDDIYLAARLMVGAEIQAITYHEFLPVLVGAEAMPPYQGYDANVNPGIENAFSTAGYRVGHTMLSPVIERIGADGNPDPAGHLPLRQAFFNPSEVAAHGIDSMLRGLAAGRAQEIDAMVVDDVRNFLFGPPGAGGFDLASLNMQRGRDHGLPSYNQARVDYGFAAAQGFADITTNPAVQAKLAQAYASVNDIDLWVGGLAEDHAPGAAVGPLFQAIIVDQFTRLRDGDRFWYQSVLLPSMIAQVEGRTLADIIRDNTTVAGAEIPDDVFHAPLAGFEGISTDTPLAIADLQTVESVITAPSMPVGMLEVEVDIRHTFRGDLVVEVIAPDGTARALQLGATHLSYAGTAQGDHPLSVDLRDPTAVLSQRAGGGQSLQITTGAGAFEVDGHKVSLDGLDQLTLETTPDGQVDAFSARFPGQLDFVQRDGDLSVLTRGLGAEYHREGERLTLDFAEADVALRSQGLTAHIEGGAALLDRQQLQIQVERAQVMKALGTDLDVEVEDLTLRLTRSEQGALQGLDLALGNLDAHVAGMDVLVRTPSGERVRLSLTADADGNTIKQAFLQIPEGGELRLTRDDLDVRLGGQRISFEHGDDGVYRLRGEGLDIDAKTRDAQVSVTGGDAQVSLDPATGRLVIDEIRGTHVDVHTKDADVHLDIQEMRDFMVRMTGLSGGATGAALHLVPTSDGATLTAELHADIGGIPVQVRVSDAHELVALGEVSVNQVHVYAGDPSGRGEIKIGVGPLSLEGSAVELVGRYHPYDPGRMVESLHQFVTLDGGQVFSGVRFEPDGVLRLGTDREGLNGELAVMLPRQLALPGYRLDMTTEPSLAPGVIGSVGYRSGDVTASAFAGLLPGSHATLHVKQGTAEVAGLRVPERTDLPTTAVAGLRLDLADVDGGHLSAVGGAFVNPLGLTTSRFVEESTPYGAFGGLEYSKDNWFVGGSAVVDVNQGKPELGGFQLRLGVRF